MKIALYIEQGRDQIVLTPESKHETAILAHLVDQGHVLYIRQGSFYKCQGGWTRQGDDVTSTILVIEPKEPA